MLSDRHRVDAGRGRSVECHGDTDTRDADEDHRNQVDDDEQQQEEAATKLTQVVEPVGTDLARRDAVPTVNGEYETAAVQVRWCEEERYQPRDCDDSPRPRLAVDGNRTQRMNNGIVSATQNN